MKKYILAAFLFLFPSHANAEVTSAICDGLKGKGIYVNKGKVTYEENEKISSKITFMFIYSDNKIVDNTGNEYVMLKEDGTITGILHSRLTDNLITFYPNDNIVILSKHSYWKGLSTGHLDISAWTVQGKCEFK